MVLSETDRTSGSTSGYTWSLLCHMANASTASSYVWFDGCQNTDVPVAATQRSGVKRQEKSCSKLLCLPQSSMEHTASGIIEQPGNTASSQSEHWLPFSCLCLLWRSCKQMWRNAVKWEFIGILICYFSSHNSIFLCPLAQSRGFCGLTVRCMINQWQQTGAHDRHLHM